MGKNTPTRDDVRCASRDDAHDASTSSDMLIPCRSSSRAIRPFSRERHHATKPESSRHHHDVPMPVCPLLPPSLV